MKVKVGGSASMKIMVFQYEPIEVSTTLEIEEEFNDGDKAEEWLVAQGDKINESIKIDLEKKIKQVAKEQSALKKRLKDMI